MSELEDKNKIATSIVTAMIDERLKPIEAALTELRETINKNTELTEAKIKTISDALSILDKDFKGINQRKPFSLGFLSFDFED